MSDGGRISRRTVLRGVGTVVALPFLEAMLPEGPGRRRRRSGRPDGWPSSTCPTAPSWPTGPRRPKGPDFDLPPILEPLAPLSGRPARPQRPDLRQGPGQRRRRRRPRPGLVRVPDRLPGAEDRRRQLPVGDLGRPGRRPADRRPDPAPLAGTRASNATGAAGNCDSGYSCVYEHTISWRSPTSPLPNEVDPRLDLRPPLLRAAQRPRPPQAEPAAGQRARRRARRRQGAGEQARRRRPPEARPVPLLRPRAGAADRPRRDPAAGPAARGRGPAAGDARPTWPSTSA